jgi:hypothetical protein
MLKHNLADIPAFLIWNAHYYKPNYQAIPGVDIQKWLTYLKSISPMTSNKADKKIDPSIYTLKN